MKGLRGSVATAGAVLAITSAAGEAYAAGFASQQFGGEMGSVVATNPTALYYNPGAIGFSEGSALGTYGSLAMRSATYSHDLNVMNDRPDPPDAQGANTGKATLFNVFGGASLGGTTHIGNLVIGAGFFAPFFGISHWGKNDSFSNSAKYPLAVDGVQRWFGIDGKIEILYFTAAAAYRLGPISLGVSGNFISSTVSAFQAKNPSGAGFPDTTAEGRAYMDAHSYGGSFAGGAMVEILRDQLWFGGSYQAQPDLGEQTLNGDLFVSGPGQKTPTHYNVDFHQTLPDIIRGGFRFHPKTIPWEFRLFGDYTRWSSMQTQCVVLANQKCTVDSMGRSATGVQQYYIRNWKDTIGARVGASYWLQPEIELFVGAGYETQAVPDETMAPDLFDANNILGALGGRFKLTRTLFATASYTHIQYMNRDNTNKSILTQKMVPTQEGDSGGRYTQWVGVFTGNLEAMF